MSRVVFVWELGSSLSHVSHLLKLAKLLRAQGHEVSMVVRELHNLRNLAVEGVRVLQAPVWLPQVAGLPEPPLSYAEILLRFGYHNPANLGGLVDAWRDLYRILEPDLVVANHAPTAMLAARSLQIRTAVQGGGFLVPPRETPMPNMRPWISVPPQRLAEAEAAVLGTVNTLLEGYGARRLAFLGELFDVAETFLTTFPELDHYPGRRGASYRGPLFSSGSGAIVDWPAGEGPRVFGYLEPFARDFDAAMLALSRIQARALICAPGISSNALEKWRGQGIEIATRPLNLDGLLGGCDFALTYCGHGIVAQLLLSGVPLLMFPDHLERFLTAWRVHLLGAGIIVNPEAAAPPLAPLMQALLKESRYRQQAQAFAGRHAGFDVATAEAGILRDIQRLIGDLPAATG